MREICLTKTGVLVLTDLIDLKRGRGVCDNIRWGPDDNSLVVNTFTVDSGHTVNADLEHRLLVGKTFPYRSWVVVHRVPTVRMRWHRHAGDRLSHSARPAVCVWDHRLCPRCERDR